MEDRKKLSAMKSIVVTSSSTTKLSALGDRSDTPRDSCYFPGCRKDTNCKCDICLASINATLDLVPSTAQQSTLTKLSTSRLTPQITPISFDPLTPSTPEVFSRRNLMPYLWSTAEKTRSLDDKKRRYRSSWYQNWSLLACVVLISVVVDLGFQRTALGILQPAVMPQAVQRICEESGKIGNLSQRLEYVQRKLVKELIHGEVSDCSSLHSIWELNQDGFLLHSRCVLYKSRAEEVSIWGWPMQTAGVLLTGFSSRSFTILSGRITEWSNGGIKFLVRQANSSWVHGKWSTSALQLDPNTWVLEYRRSALLQNSRLITAAMELLIFRVSRVVRILKQDFWIASFPYKYNNYPVKEEDEFKYPT